VNALLREQRFLVMGVINLTPDSFSDGGLHQALPDAVTHGLRLAAEGADILDLGGESTRPGAQPVTVQQELDRVIPVIEALRTETDLPISVDTSKAAVMLTAVSAGATMINDVRALRDEGALAAAANLGVPVCLMHMRGKPRTMQAAPRYRDVVADVAAFLRERADAAVAAGVPRDRVIVDPGFGFGKTIAHNLELLRELPQIAALGYPVLVGLSRKSMLGQLTGRGVDERLAGSIALALLAAERGASILRVHDVAPTVDALRILAAVRD
jgi:dihydropteroate synthase